MSRTRVNVTHRILAVLLALVMVIGLMPLTIVASVEDYPGYYTVTIEDAEKAGIADATVDYIVSVNDTEDASDTSLTDSDGVVGIDLSAYADGLEAGDTISIAFTVTKDGYVAKEETVNVTAVDGTHVITMEAASEPEPEPEPVEQFTVSVQVDGDAKVQLNGVEQNSVTVDDGSDVSVIITPGDHAYIESLTIGDENVSVAKGDSYSGSVTVDQDIEITVALVNEYDVTVSEHENGIVTLDDVVVNELTLKEGTKVAVKVTPDEGYRISFVSIGGAVQTVSDATSFTTDVEVNDDIDIVVAFVKVYTVTVTHGANGSVVTDPESEGGSVVVATGTNVKITATPNKNYRVDAVTINGEEQVITNANDSVYTNTLEVGEDYEIVVTFAPNTYQIIVSDTENGEVTVDAETVEHDGSVQVTVTPTVSHLIDEITVNGEAVEVTPRDDNSFVFTISSITEVKEIKATFKVKTFSVSANENTNGKVDISDSTVEYNGESTITVKPNDGQTIASITVNEVEVTEYETNDDEIIFTIKDIIENKAIEVTYVVTETIALDNVTFNSEDAIRVAGKLYVYANGATITFSTDKQGIRIFDENNVRIDGGKNTNAVTINKTTTISKIELYYKADNAWTRNWHEVNGVSKNDPLRIVVDTTLNEKDIIITPDDANENGFYNDSFNVTIYAEDAGDYSGISQIKYWVTSNGDVTQEGTFDGNKSNEQNGQFSVFVNENTNNSDNVVIHATVTDLAGNEVTVDSGALKVNCTAPKLEKIEIVEVDYEHDHIIDTPHSGYYSTPRKVTITITDRASTFDEEAATKAIRILARSVTLEELSIDTKINWTSEGNTHVATIEFNEDALYSWNISDEVKYVNKASVELDTSAVETSGGALYNFTVDKTQPVAEISVETDVWNDILSTLTFGIWKNYEITVSVEEFSVVDKTSATEMVQYYKSNSDTKLTEEELEKLYQNGEFSESKYTVRADEKFVVYARIADYAGNVRYISTNGIIVDQTDSLITFTPDAPNEDNFYNKDVHVNISVSEIIEGKGAYSGIKSVHIQVLKEGKITWEKLETEAFDLGVNTEHPTYEDLVAEWSTDIIVDSEENNSDNVIVKVTVVDNAGNDYSKELPLRINIDKPTATIEFKDQANTVVDAHGYFGASRTAEITVIDRTSAFDETAATAGITYTKTKANPDVYDTSDIVISDWSHDGNKHTATVTFVADGEYTWSFTYTNKADNEMESISTGASVTPFSFTVDTTDPTASISIEKNTWSELLNVLTFGLWNNKQFNITATDNDYTSPVIKEYYVATGDEATSPLSGDELDQKTFEEYKDFTINSNQQFVVYLKVTDYAGNRIYISTDGAIVDQVDPVIELSPEDPNANGIYGISYGETVDVAVKVTDAAPYSGIKSVDYWIVKDGNEDNPTQSANLFTFVAPEHEDNATPKYEDLVSEWNDTIHVITSLNNSCDVVVHVKVVDNAGNDYEKTVKLDIDMTAPTIDVSFDNNDDNDGNTYFDEQRTATIVITERSHHFDADKATAGITISAVDVDGNAVEDAYTLSDWVPVDGVTADATTHTATIFFEKDANYTWTVTGTDQTGITYTDKADNVDVGVNTGDSVAPFDFTVDTIAPTGTVKATSAEDRETEWNTLRAELTFGFWSKEKITINGTSDDVTSPVAKVEYYKVVAVSANDSTIALTAEDLDEVTEWTAFNGFDVSENQQFIVYIKVTDMAGNYTYLSTNGLIVDDQAPVEEVIAPEITIEPEQPINGFYNGDVKVAIKVTDPLVGGTYSGLQTITYKVFNMGVETQTGTLYTFEVEDPTQSELLQTWTGEIVVNSELNNSNDIDIVIYAGDNSLNLSEDMVEIMIDITAPTINVTYSNNDVENDVFFDADRTATIVVTERNFDPEDVILTITNTDGVIPTISNWTQSAGSGNLDDTKWTATIIYTADGDYEFAVAYTDLAGNDCETIDYGNSVAPTKFTIDQTKPVVSVSYDNNSAKNEKYFNADRTATIVIVEHNFTLDRVEFTQSASLNGEVISIPEATWVHDGDSHTATIAYTTDGDYTFDVSVRDMVSNESDSADYGSTVSGKEFTVDKTIEKPAFSGVQNGIAYKEDVIPVIDFADVNYESYEVKLVRTRRGEKDVDVTDAFIKSITEETQGGSGTNDTFEKIADNDGIYTLTVKMVDKAGNEETQSITFTVNRFGSVYEYEDYLVSLIGNGGAYVGSVTNDLIISEYNADRLVGDSLNIEITRDGKPLEQVIFDVSPVINDQVEVGESGWFQYQYTISKDNFAEDGVYKISISSQDATGNEPENSNYDDKNILFRVDSTAPEITSIVGLEDSIINAQEVTVKYTVFDTIGLKSIMIFVDGVQVGETITDFGTDLNNYSGSFVLSENSNAQTVRIVVEDQSGNIIDTDAEDFSSAYAFNKSVTVSTNIFVRWYANQPLFWGSIIGTMVLAAAIWFIIIFVRKKKNEAK